MVLNFKIEVSAHKIQLSWPYISKCAPQKFMCRRVRRKKINKTQVFSVFKIFLFSSRNI